MIIVYIAKERELTFSLSFLSLLCQMLGRVAEDVESVPWITSSLIRFGVDSVTFSHLASPGQPQRNVLPALQTTSVTNRFLPLLNQL